MNLTGPEKWESSLFPQSLLILHFFLLPSWGPNFNSSRVIWGGGEGLPPLCLWPLVYQATPHPLLWALEHTNQKRIHWWLLSVLRLPGKYCDKALMNYNLRNLVFCPLLLILSGISLSWLLCAGLWTGYPPVWHLTPEFLRSGRDSSAQEVSPYSRDETESCRSGNSSFTSLIDSLQSLCFPSSNVKIKKKRNPSSFYCGVCVAAAASDKLDVRVSGDKVTYLTN